MDDDLKSEDYLVCSCMGIKKSDIKKAIEQGDKDLETLSKKLGLGMGCSSCLEEAQEILKEKN